MPLSWYPAGNDSIPGIQRFPVSLAAAGWIKIPNLSDKFRNRSIYPNFIFKSRCKITSIIVVAWLCLILKHLNVVILQHTWQFATTDIAQPPK
jgi:hypothetical protein